MAFSCPVRGLAELDRDRRHRHRDRPPPRAARPPRLTVSPGLADGVATLVIVGELDLTTIGVLAKALEPLLAGAPRRLVFDLTRVGFIDVAAARLISGATATVPAAGRPVIRRPGPAARRVLELTGFAGLCEVEE
ncbi:MAG: STAS domain-containing protein [Actinobacteria bacterium]|nr:STAS domain-containing protein [Actinomycetota bacterium]